MTEAEMFLIFNILRDLQDSIQETIDLLGATSIPQAVEDVRRIQEAVDILTRELRKQ